MIQVYHLSHIDRDDWRYDAIHFPRIASAPPEFGDVKDVTALAVNLLIAEGSYEHVADIRTFDLETAWSLTNSVDSAWYERQDKRLSVVPNSSRRSTSVGDIMITEDAVVRVARTGYEIIKGPLS